jgi:hypothetical protein
MPNFQKWKVPAMQNGVIVRGGSLFRFYYEMYSSPSKERFEQVTVSYRPVLLGEAMNTKTAKRSPWFLVHTMIIGFGGIARAEIFEWREGSWTYVGGITTGGSEKPISDFIFGYFGFQFQ